MLKRGNMVWLILAFLLWLLFRKQATGAATGSARTDYYFPEWESQPPICWRDDFFPYAEHCVPGFEGGA